MKKIKILGAGPSGLSAAILLAKAGYYAEVFERNVDAGKRFYGDIQGLENWTEKIDVLEDLRGRGIEINFDCDPFSDFTFTNGTKNQKCVSNKPS
jgi:flavin-dependent dehydrogenase